MYVSVAVGCLHRLCLHSPPASATANSRAFYLPQNKPGPLADCPLPQPLLNSVCSEPAFCLWVSLSRNPQFSLA